MFYGAVITHSGSLVWNRAMINVILCFAGYNKSKISAVKKVHVGQ